jgi:molybdopterin synthase catalytic subunit
MTARVCEVLLTEEVLVPPPEMAGDETGAVVDFWGVVRGTEENASISGIEYEAHRVMAEHQLRVIAEEAAERFELTRIIVHHRTAFVPVGQASLFVRVGSRHRAAAFRAAQWLVDELKKRAPIWKHPKVVEQQQLESSPR